MTSQSKTVEPNSVTGLTETMARAVSSETSHGSYHPHAYNSGPNQWGMTTDLDPVWTDRAPTMRILDPLGVESIEGSLQDRLLRPVLSIAITQRLRYLSYWAWITANVEEHSAAERALYEKPLLLASTSHDCPEDGTGTSGIMGVSEDLEEQLDAPTTDTIDISPEAFTITSSDVARFDAYYKGVLYRLLLFEDEWTLTPLGERLAAAYDRAIDVEFQTIQQAVETEQLPIECLNSLANGGCLCQLTEVEEELLIQAYWFLVTPTREYSELAFDQTPAPELLELRDYLGTTPNDDETALIEATLAGTDETTVADYDEDLDRLFSTGRTAFVRSSLILLLSLGDWVTRRPTPEPEFEALAQSRDVWRLLVHSEYTSHAIQALFISLQETVRLTEPITPTALLETIFGHPTFREAVGQVLDGVELSVSDDDRDVMAGIRDAIYFGEAPTGQITATVGTDVEPVTDDWATVIETLRTHTPSEKPFHLDSHSERAYRTLIDETLAAPPTLTTCRQVAAYSAIQLARIATRYEQYFAKDSQTAYVEWFRTAHTDPGPITCWELHPDHPEAPTHDPVQVSSAGKATFADTMAGFTQRWVLTHYFERLYEKITDGNGKSPQLLQLDTDGRLSFNHQGNGGDVYNGGTPNAPTLKFDRLGDIFYELGLIENNSLSSMHVTDRGRDLVAAFTSGGSR